MRWTEDQLKEHLQRRGEHAATSNAGKKSDKMLALGRLKTGILNKTEQAYSDVLESMKNAGDIVWFKFEGIKLRLADNTFFTPDFFVMRKDGQLECVEVKGFMMEDANVKIKVAASMYPFRFFIVRKRGGGWDMKVIGE